MHHFTRILVLVGVLSLLSVLGIELALSVRQQSQTIDEAVHLFAGYRYWKNLDFGTNPEHPPLVKLVAAAPLVPLRLRVPQLSSGDFKRVEYLSGREFLYSNDADAVLFRTRMAASSFALALALLVFVACYEMFGVGPAFLTLVLLVFEPSILANGALVMTDMGVSCCLFLSVYMFYRYVKRPSVLKLLATGLAAGLALAAKHSGVLIFPMLILLALSEQLRALRTLSDPRSPNREPKLRTVVRQVLRLAGSLVLVAGISLAVLWSFYAFRFDARPMGLKMTPPLTEFAGPARHPIESQLVQTLARYRILPEAYIFGFVDVAKNSKAVPPRSSTALLGKVYPRGKWFYYPVAFLIKSTIALLLLCLVLPFAPGLRRPELRREVIFLTVPFAFYVAVAMLSGITLGFRHILPASPFLLALVGYAAWSLASRHRRWAYALAAVMALHVISSARAFPNYLSYSNEIAGGPSNTYRLLADSNSGQGLKNLKLYIDRHRIKSCWFGYVGWPVAADPAYYGIPCKLLPSSTNRFFGIPLDVIPAAIQGPVFLSASEIFGRFWGAGEMNPYVQFRNIRPADSIAGDILAFNGRFDLPLAAALSHVNRATQLLQNNQAGQALAEARAAVALAPDSVDAQVALGTVAARMGGKIAAQADFRRALSLAQQKYPEYQQSWVGPLRNLLTGLHTR